ncbi:hypothetical protein TorRG33x02_287530 [Trema orientale]|uniref:Uncharacterized protein n=1 Tax=Trema orientale TaxID=63057 RepID=A0A2P5CF53_TREOI|nr:hypothetical protein TorRG33x02_287530 [Trema orientale]
MIAWLQTTSDGSFSTTALEGTKTLEKGLEGFGDDGGEAAETSSENKPVQLHRRQRGSSNSNSLTRKLDLLTIPGMGPKNLRKLVENGISDVAELKQPYKDKVLYWTLSSSFCSVLSLYFFEV